MKDIFVPLDPDDGPRNFAALAAVGREVTQRGGNARILLQEGRYPVWNERGCLMFDDLLHGRRPAIDDEGWRRDRNPVFDFADCADVEVDGQGAALDFLGLAQPLACFRSSGITVKNLAVDFKRPPYTVGTILHVDGEEYHVGVGEFPVFENSPVVAVHEHDPVRGRLTGVCLYHNPQVTFLRPGVVKMIHPEASRLRSGNIVFLRHIYSFAPGLQFYRCRDVRVDGVTLHALPGMGIIGHLCHDIHVSRFQIKPSPGRILSINVDGTHFISCTGTITVEDSHFEGMGDDATNIHSFYFKICRINGTRSLRVKVEATPQDFYPNEPDVGDAIEFVRVATLAPYAEERISLVKMLPDGLLDLEFSEILPETFRPDDVLSNVSKLAAFRFVRNTVKNIRGRAALIQTRDALVQDCHFEFCTGQGVHIDTATGWWESGATRNVRVKNNRFLNCGYGFGRYCKAAGVVVGTECEVPEPGVHREIEISGNRIEGPGDKPGLWITSADEVELSRNEIVNCEPPVRIEHCGSVRIA